MDNFMQHYTALHPSRPRLELYIYFRRSERSMKLTIHLRLCIGGALPQLNHTSSLLRA